MSIDLNDWAPVHRGIAGPLIFVSRRMSGRHQFYVEIRKARGLCALVSRICSDCRRRKWRL